MFISQLTIQYHQPITHCRHINSHKNACLHQMKLFNFRTFNNKGCIAHGSVKEGVFQKPTFIGTEACRVHAPNEKIYMIFEVANGRCLMLMMIYSYSSHEFPCDMAEYRAAGGPLIANGFTNTVQISDFFLVSVNGDYLTAMTF